MDSIQYGYSLCQVVNTARVCVRWLHDDRTGRYTCPPDRQESLPGSHTGAPLRSPCLRLQSYAPPSVLSSRIVPPAIMGVGRSLPNTSCLPFQSSESLPLFVFIRWPPERKASMPFPTPRIRPFVPLCVLLFLHRKAPSCWPPLEYLPHQFQKNANHFD